MLKIKFEKHIYSKCDKKTKQKAFKLEIKDFP